MGNRVPVDFYECDYDYEDRQSPSEEELLEGVLVRKHEWENTTKKATNRSWDKVYAVMRGTQLCFYRDVKSYKSAPETFLKNEPPLELRGGATEVAQDYTKKKHVFRLKAANGAELLFQAKDDEEMNQWVGAVRIQCNGGASAPARSQTLPAGPAGGEQKRRSFFTLKKN